MSSPEADLLKVAPNAGLDEIKRAYRKAALAHHPDHNPDPAAARHFRRINEAYRLLAERAQPQEPKPKRTPPQERVGYLLADLRALVKRWPAARWNRAVDGLPAAVWVAGMLDVLAQNWPRAPRGHLVVPTVEGIAAALEDWSGRLEGWPLPSPLPRKIARAFDDLLSAAELRLKALDRPSRRAAQ